MSLCDVCTVCCAEWDLVTLCTAHSTYDWFYYRYLLLHVYFLCRIYPIGIYMRKRVTEIHFRPYIK